MPFTMPTFDELIQASNSLPDDYKVERLAKDKNRFLSSYRGDTVNRIRQGDIEFIKNLAANISVNQADQTSLKELFKNDKITQEQVTTFLQNALAGALMLYFSKVNDNYWLESRVKDGSALATVTCKLFRIEQFSDIPEDKLEACLQAFQHYFRFINTTSSTTLNWHDSKSAKDIFKELVKEMKELNIGTRSSICTPP